MYVTEGIDGKNTPPPQINPDKNEWTDKLLTADRSDEWK